jgi:hypothetical protein
VSHHPTFVDRPLDTVPELFCRAAGFEEGSVDELNIDAPVLGRLGRVGDFHELARCGVGISEVARFDEFHGPRAEMGNVDQALLDPVAVKNYPLRGVSCPAHADGLCNRDRREPAAISWPDAVGQIAGERAKAETCVGLMKKYGDDAQKARGEITYTDAKADFDAVIAGLIVALSAGQAPASLSSLQDKLSSGVSGLSQFCGTVVDLLPKTAGQTEKGVMVDIAKMIPLEQLLKIMSDGVSALYTNHRSDDALHARGRRILVLDPGRHWLQPRHRRQDCQAAGEASGLRCPCHRRQFSRAKRTAKKQKGIADCPAIPFTSKVSHLSRNCHSLL